MSDISAGFIALPLSAQWSCTNLERDHKGALEALGVDVPVLSHRAVEKRKREFYAGRWCAAQAIYNKTGLYLTPKINSDRSPLWPDGIVGSISHSDKNAIALIDTKDRCFGIGLDIQGRISAMEIQEIESLILNQQELKLCNKIPENRGFDVFFSAKESLYKALYPRSLDLFEHKEVEIIHVDQKHSKLEIRLLRNLKMHWLKNQTFCVHYWITCTDVLTWIYIAD